VFTLAGAVGGVLLGFGLSAYASLKWDLVTSGKPVLAWFAFMVVAFELAVLLGALGNFFSMLLLSGLPRLRTSPGYDPAFSRDRWGIFTPCDLVTFNRIREALESAGALEIREVKGEGEETGRACT
jgi:molybdopterin-containing oxidoreductase family membrane subunit